MVSARYANRGTALVHLELLASSVLAHVAAGKPARLARPDHDEALEAIAGLSPAVDETGYVQPANDALRAGRGVNNVYHNNAMQVWWVRADGEVENVEIA